MASRAALLGLLGLLVGCQSIETHHNADPQAPFASYKTFAWVTEEPLIQPGVGSVPGSRPADPLLDPLIRDAVERNLKARGYEQLRDPKIADLVVSFSVGARDKIEVDSYPVTAGYRYQVYGGYRTDVRTYTEGVLALDFFDGRTKRAVWHGYATKRLSQSPTPEKRLANVNQATDAILAEFPSHTAPPPK
ncbi:MAG TPA: DUF4136 domain-containing protein [Myxococcota bacterium]|nr:DUF4136 domain-containing protein [Myxococcota bacterium]